MNSYEILVNHISFISIKFLTVPSLIKTLSMPSELIMPLEPNLSEYDDSE